MQAQGFHSLEALKISPNCFAHDSIGVCTLTGKYIFQKFLKTFTQI